MTDLSSGILLAGLSKSNQRLELIFLDLLWKFLWVILTSILGTAIVFWLLAEIGSAQLQGPELDTANPIILFTVMERLRATYSGTVIWAVGGFFLGAAALWLLLEALFRGGWKDFRLYFASGAARLAILTAAAVILLAMLGRERTPGLAIIAAIIMMSTWFLVTTIETLVRKDAVELMGAKFGELMTVMASLFMTELLLAAILWGSAVVVLLNVSGRPELLAAVSLIAVVTVLWSVVHSYLVNVRFASVDIMRRSIDG